MPVQEQEKITSKDVIGMLFQAMEQANANAWVPLISNEFTSTQATETYAGIGTSPQMREWLGGKKAKGFREQSLQISNKDWESTISIKVKDLRRDKTGYIQLRIQELMQRAVQHQAKLISDLIENGAATTLGACYDGKALFADDHGEGDSGTIDNKISVDISALPIDTAVAGTVSDPHPLEFAHSALQAVLTMQGFKDDQGEPINELANSFLIMVPTGLSKAARLAMSQPQIRQDSNPLINDTINYRVVVNPRLTWTDKFAVFRADGTFKPFISQIEEQPMFKALAEGSDHAFKEAEHLYSVEKSGNVGYGRFDQAVQVTMT